MHQAYQILLHLTMRMLEHFVMLQHGHLLGANINPLSEGNSPLSVCGGDSASLPHLQ